MFASTGSPQSVPPTQSRFGPNAPQQAERPRTLVTQSPVMALFGPHAMSELGPLWGAKRKLDIGTARAAFDPTETLESLV